MSTITAPGLEVWEHRRDCFHRPHRPMSPSPIADSGPMQYYGRSFLRPATRLGVIRRSGYEPRTKSMAHDCASVHAWAGPKAQRPLSSDFVERKTSGGALLKRWTYTYSLADNMTTKETYDGSTTETYTYFFTPGKGAKREAFRLRWTHICRAPRVDLGPGTVRQGVPQRSTCGDA